MWEQSEVKICKYCQHANIMQSNADIICKYKGKVSEDGHCRKYKYDILKKEVRRRITPQFDKYNEDSFRID